MIFGHSMFCLRHNCLKTGNFSFFHIGTGILNYFNARNWDPGIPSGPSNYPGDIGYQGNLKISKADVKVRRSNIDQRKLKKINMVQ